MKRGEFIKTCGYSCLGASAIGMLMQSCISSKTITVELSGENIIVPLSEFEKSNNNNTSYRDYIIIQNAQLQYPIYIFRFSESDYSALFLECSHQGNELNAYGEKLVCSAHGSEFDNRGNVTVGPASSPLKSFPIELDQNNIIISLKAS